MRFRKLVPSDIEAFGALIGPEWVITDAEAVMPYGRDETEDLFFAPEVVLKPSTVQEVSDILTYCNAQLIPVTPRGAGTGLSGGALPVYGGVVLSLERFNRILEIDERNHQVLVEPGVVTETLQEAVRARGLFYPPDPASKGSCFIGGNVAENSGGPKAVKYGVVKDYVLNLEVVLPTGEVIWTGANVLKNATGYNLTQLLVGSEGTLGVVTKIVLRLLPHPAYDLLMLVPFRRGDDACLAVKAIFQQGIIPSALEFMERDAVLLSRQLMPQSVEVDERAEAFLLIEVDGNDQNPLMQQMETIASVVETYEVGELQLAETAEQKTLLWKLRRQIAEAIRRYSVYKEEDTVVPRAELPRLWRGVKAIGDRHGFRSVCYGHAGDGNLHVNILRESMDDHQWKELLPQAITEIFQLCVRLKGTISGEHGIGWVQKPYVPIVFNDVQLRLMKQLKSVFDPNHILNPGKIF